MLRIFIFVLALSNQQSLLGGDYLPQRLDSVLDILGYGFIGQQLLKSRLVKAGYPFPQALWLKEGPDFLFAVAGDVHKPGR